MGNTPIIIDLTYLYSITGGDKSFEQMLLSGTLADVDMLIGALKESWIENDPEGVRKSAHSLVSLSAIAGMPQVEGWSRALDQAFADGEFHPEESELAYNIIGGWPVAKSQLEKLITTN